MPMSVLSYILCTKVNCYLLSFHNFFVIFGKLFVTKWMFYK